MTKYNLILLVLLCGTSYAQTIVVDSAHIHEKDSTLVIYGTLPASPFSINIENFPLTLKKWAVDKAEFSIPLKGAGSSGQVAIINGPDTNTNLVVEEWVVPIHYRHSTSVPSSPQSWPPTTSSELRLYIRFVINTNNSTQKFPVSRRSTWAWDCNTTYSDYPYKAYYSGSGFYKWNDIAGRDSNGFVVECSFDEKNDSIMLSFPPPKGAICHFEFWYEGSPINKLSEADNPISYRIPTLHFSTLDTVILPSVVHSYDTVANFYTHRITSWDTIRRAIPLRVDSSLAVTDIRKANGGFISCYPNPFTKSTAIEFLYPSSEPQMVVVTDMIGRVVSTLTSEYSGNSLHKLQFIPEGLNPGLYFCHLLPLGTCTIKLVYDK